VPRNTLVQRSFESGELAPALTARADLARYTTGLRTCRNFIVQRAGGAANRPGTTFLAAAKTTNQTYLYPFVFAAADASYVIEAGGNYFRFYHNGVRVTVSGVTAWSNATAYVVGDLASLAGVNYYCILAHTNQTPPNATYWYPLTGNIYEIPTPYVVGRFQDPARAHFEQQGNIITITHLDEPPRELRYESATRWTLTLIATGPTIAAPTGGSGTAGGVGTRTFKYVVTAGKAETYEESDPSSAITVASAADPTETAPVALSWTPVSGAVEYYVYSDPFGNGTYGFIGTATGAAAFNDTGLTPDFNLTPPVPRALFIGTNNYPATSVTYQQRRIFAGTHNNREQVFASQVGFRANYGIRSPLQDDDAVTFTLASKTIQPIHHMVALKRLILLTDSRVWRIEGDEAGTLLPTAINADEHAYVGSAFVEPVALGNALVYVQARGTVLRDLQFSRELEGLTGRDLTLLSTHLFTNYTIVEMDLALVPNSVIWCVRSDGTLLGLTYIPEEDVVAWHRHDTDGLFESVAVVPEGDEDAVYFVVKRTINGVAKRYVERLHTRKFTDLEDGYFVDCGITYSGAATTTITGLTHLQGKTVYGLADGVVVGPFTVPASGAIALTTAASTVHVGLAMTAQFETLDIDVQGSSIRDKRKRVSALALLLESSTRGFFVGPDSAHLTEFGVEGPWDTDTLVSGQVELTNTTTYTNHGRVFIEHTDPTPLTILGVLPHVDIGG
jgi:hypothetical protein